MLLGDLSSAPTRGHAFAGVAPPGRSFARAACFCSTSSSPAPVATRHIRGNRIQPELIALERLHRLPMAQGGDSPNQASGQNWPRFVPRPQPQACDSPSRILSQALEILSERGRKAMHRLISVRTKPVDRSLTCGTGKRQSKRIPAGRQSRHRRARQQTCSTHVRRLGPWPASQLSFKAGARDGPRSEGATRFSLGTAPSTIRLLWPAILNASINFKRPFSADKESSMSACGS